MGTFGSGGCSGPVISLDYLIVPSQRRHMTQSTPVRDTGDAEAIPASRAACGSAQNFQTILKRVSASAPPEAGQDNTAFDKTRQRFVDS